MNFEDGSILAKVNNTKKKLYVSDNTDDITTVHKEIKLPLGQTFQMIPTDKERDIIYITGQSGSGKSYFTKMYVEEYNRKFKNKNNIYLFSAIDDDESIDSIKNLKRVNIKDPEFLEESIELDDLKNSMCIFDDVDTITSKHIRAKVYSILNMILQTGRHANISVVYTSHICCAGAETKLILSEAHAVVIFPKTMGNRSLKYLCDSYFGMDKHQIQKIKTIGGRHAIIHKTYPMVVMGQNTAFTTTDL